jgi:hypothetical protein
MTQRKPGDLSFDSWIDAQIREAEARGLFEDLSGSGRPQRNLRDAEDPMWWAKQFLQRESVSYLPPAVEVRVRAQKLREVLASLPSERAVREAAEALNADIRRVNRTASEGPPTAQAALEIEELVAAWRSAQSRRDRAAELSTMPAGERKDSPASAGLDPLRLASESGAREKGRPLPSIRRRTRLP